MMKSSITLLVLLLIDLFCTESFIESDCRKNGYLNNFSKSNNIFPLSPKVYRRTLSFAKGNNNDNNDTNDASKIYDNDNLVEGIDQDLLRPPINIRKESILFGDNPATAQNNNIRRLWKILRDNLPYVFTGVSSVSESQYSNQSSNFIDKNPVGAIYNVIFVRLPTILAGVFYVKNLLQGHPLYLDIGFGSGPSEINPLFVLAVLYVILR